MRQEIEHIIARALGGHAGAEDLAALDVWLAERKENLWEFGKLKAYWESEAACLRDVSPEEAYARVRDRLDAD